jgi:hypothetical protein
MPFECIANTLQQKDINYFRSIEYTMLNTYSDVPNYETVV